MKNSEGSVKCAEPPIFKLADIILQQGYITGDNYSDFCHQLHRENMTIHTREVGILKVVAPGQRYCLFFSKPPKVEGIGNIRIGRQSWTMEVYGRNNVSELENLASQLREEFGVTINLALEREHPKEGDLRDITNYTPD